MGAIINKSSNNIIIRNGNVVVKKKVIEYGLLYNWLTIWWPYTSIAPIGWHVPTTAEFETLRLYVASQGWNFDGTTTPGTDYNNKQAKALVANNDWYYDPEYDVEGSPGNNDHPEMLNKSGFSAIAAGYRDIYGDFAEDRTWDTSFWTSTESSSTIAYYWNMYSDSTSFLSNYYFKSMGLSIRLVRDSDIGWSPGDYLWDIDLNKYGTVKIGNQIWTTQNLAVKRFRDGSNPIHIPGKSEWANNDVLPAYCTFNNGTHL
jgi:uncharacterized protein (TIGR02145 family)